MIKLKPLLPKDFLCENQNWDIIGTVNADGEVRSVRKSVTSHETEKFKDFNWIYQPGNKTVSWWDNNINDFLKGEVEAHLLKKYGVIVKRHRTIMPFEGVTEAVNRENDYILLGTVDWAGNVKSTKTSDRNVTHYTLNYKDHTWRYNPDTGVVVWWDDNITEYLKEEVSAHLLKKYGITVTRHKTVLTIPFEGVTETGDDSLSDDEKDDEEYDLANLYFSIGQDDDENMHRNYCWLWSKADGAVKAKKGGTHSINFGYGVKDNTFSGWFDIDKNIISIVFPDNEKRKLGNKKPTEDDIPERIYQALTRKFGKRNPNFMVFEAINFSGRGDEYVILGTISSNGDIKSTKTTDVNMTHARCGYGRSGFNWRYNPSLKTVYWWDTDTEPWMKDDVTEYLLKKYGVTVRSHKYMMGDAGFLAEDGMFDDDYVILGTITSGGVKSTKTYNENMTHAKSGYGRQGHNWRYNPIIQTVYWWDRDITSLMKEEVSAHLLKKYGVIINRHAFMMPLENVNEDSAFDGGFIIIGTIDYDYWVQSKKVTDKNTTHETLDYRDFNWRYNLASKAVYWWDWYEITQIIKSEVANHLKHKYNVEVKYNKPVLANRDAKPAADDVKAQYKRDSFTHPFGEVCNIKFKQLIPENIAQPEFDDDYIIIGMLDYGDNVTSTKTSDGNTTHHTLGYDGMNWRYNPITKTVYWWELDEVGKDELKYVKTHLKKKYNVDVIANKAINISSNPDVDSDKDAKKQQLAQYKLDQETHPYKHHL